ncbi:MAG: sulfur oxidation c-type cytochrome SoxA [Gammaproteobacteria bacterium]|nr:sulfur oxidation c-type cytochrome SoxA [Gammaproteobacteria bacterium]
MKQLLTMAVAVGLMGSVPIVAQATPEQDMKEYQAHYHKRFPNVPHDDFINGLYALDPEKRSQWEAIEDFPPYTVAVEEGEKLFNTPFANGKTYASCFKNGGIGIKQDYPYFDTKTGQVKTIELEINECRVKNGEKPLGYQKGDIASISAYMSWTSRGNTINVKIPNDPRALAAYESGKEHYYAKRGQLNMSCADCHVSYPGYYVRANILSPGLGQTSHFPTFRSKWQNMGTLHRRYGGCNRQVRAASFDPQSEEYRNLEYFHTYMSNGLEINGPGSRM